MNVYFGRIAVQGALVLALVLPFAAPAESGGEIRNYIISINHLVENLNYELALSRIQLARQLPRNTDDEVTISLYEGIILYELRRLEPADSVFRSALLLRPDAKLPVQVSPKVAEPFESLRKQVKQEMASLLPPSGTEKPSDKAEQKRENPHAPPSTEPAQEKREDTRIAQSPKKEEPSRVEPQASATQEAKADTKLPPMHPAPSPQNAEQKKDEPVAVQAIKKPDCASEPYQSGRNSRERQSSRLALMKQALCIDGRFQGSVHEKWMQLKNRIETASTIDERRHITTGLDQFAREFVYADPEQEKRDRLAAEQQEAKRLPAAQQEAERLAAEQREKERLAAKQRNAEWLAAQEAERDQYEKSARTATEQYASKCQPIVKADCELLLQRLLSVQEAFLRTNPSSKLVPIRQLVTIGQKIRAARTKEALQEAAHALDLWKQRQLPQ